MIRRRPALEEALHQHVQRSIDSVQRKIGFHHKVLKGHKAGAQFSPAFDVGQPETTRSTAAAKASQVFDRGLFSPVPSSASFAPPACSSGGAVEGGTASRANPQRP
jgi:hypothetical protein